MSPAQTRSASASTLVGLQISPDQAADLLQRASELTRELRKAIERQKDLTRVGLVQETWAEATAARKAMWAEVGAECAAKVRDQCKGKTARKVTIKQLATERGLSAEFLGFLIGQSERKTRYARLKHRQLLAVGLWVRGFSAQQVASALEVTTRQVRYYLAAEKQLLEALLWLPEALSKQRPRKVVRGLQ
jgi:hypothetical protein